MTLDEAKQKNYYTNIDHLLLRAGHREAPSWREQ